MERILAIDDNSDNLISLNAVLKDAFPESIVYTATNGLTGIQLAVENNPDVILLDVLMPQMDGYEVCRRIKQDERLCDIPVVFLTAVKATKESRIQALETGAEAFLHKPIDEAELTAQVRAMIKIKLSNKQKKDECERLAYQVAERTQELERSNKEMIRLLGELRLEIEARKRTESELQVEKNISEAIFNSVPGLIFLYDEEGRLIRWNRYHESMTGYAPEELSNMNFMSWLEGDEAGKKDVCKKMFSRTRNDSWEAEVNFRKKDESKIPIYLVSNRLQIMGENFFSGIGLDITERKRSEEKIKTLGKAIEQGPSSIIITNCEGCIEFVNNMFTIQTQYSLEEVKGKKPRIFNKGHLEEKAFEQMWEMLHKGETWTGEALNRKKDKNLFWEETVVSALMNGDRTISNYILIMNDITEKKQMFDDLIRAKEKAEESDRLKSAFLANMSHEIRTPLNSIIGFSDLMLDSEFDPAKQTEYAQMIYSSGKNLLTMINDILDISKIEAGQAELNNHSFQVSILLKEVQEIYAENAAIKGLDLRLASHGSTGDDWLVGDKAKLKRVLGNLVSNAIKFTKTGYVEIGVGFKPDFTQFYVKDTGIGIKNDFHSKIFERFCQVESDYTREYGGNGLGLSITKAFVELMGGKIWLESEYGKGSVFYFTMPCRGE